MIGAADRRSGFTVTSTAVAGALLGVVFTVVFAVYLFGQRTTERGNVEADLQQAALLLLYQLTQEVAEARDILLPLRPGRAYPFLAVRTLDHEIVLYTFQKAKSRLIRQVVDPATWRPAEERVACLDVDQATFAVSRHGRLVRVELALAREAAGRREVLPLVTSIGVRGW